MNERVRRSARRGAAFAVGLALLGAGGSAPDAPGLPGAERPATGRFLVADEQIRGSLFERSVVFLVSYSENGALGLMINRRTDIDLHDVVKGAVDGSGAIYIGGPVGISSMMVLVRAGSPPEHAVRVAGDVFMTVDPAILLERTGRTGAVGDLRVYAGYAGWGPGQLDAEIARGDWIVASEAIESIFDDAPDELWKKLHRRHHRLLTVAPGVSRARPG